MKKEKKKSKSKVGCKSNGERERRRRTESREWGRVVEKEDDDVVVRALVTHVVLLNRVLKVETRISCDSWKIFSDERKRKERDGTGHPSTHTTHIHSTVPYYTRLVTSTIVLLQCTAHCVYSTVFIIHTVPVWYGILYI